jgi:hypothetical protein
MQLRSATVLAVCLLTAPAALAFSLVQPHHRATTSTAPTRSNRLVVLSLTSQEILARARESAGVAAEESPKQLFEEALLDDMRQALLKLERRVQQGPGALSALEVEELDGELQRILDEMRHNQHQLVERPRRTVQDVVGTSAAPPPPAAVDVETVRNGKVVTDTSEDEGPAFEFGKGGMGQARETTNTYIIDGMDEMEPEEYQKALQKSVIDRQTKRKESGTYGNRRTWDYLNSLTGETGILKKDKKEE